MSNKRQDGSDMKREFNALWQNTLKQFDGLKDALVESSQAGMAKLDATLLRRERDQKLATLGEAMLAMVEEGKLELPQALRATVERIQELEDEIAAQEGAFRKVFHKESSDSTKAKSRSQAEHEENTAEGPDFDP